MKQAPPLAGAAARDPAPGGPRRLDLGGPWALVREGAVDVFSVRTEGGEPVGARRHLFRLGPGALLPAWQRAPGLPAVLAVPVAGASLSAADLAGAAAGIAAKRGLALLSAAVAPPGTAGDGPPAWDDERALAAWMEAVVGRAEAVIAARDEAEALRLQDKARDTRDAMAAALARLAGGQAVLRHASAASLQGPAVVSAAGAMPAGTPAAGAAPGGDAAQPPARPRGGPAVPGLLAACEQVASHAGIRLQPPPVLHGAGPLDQIEQIAQASRVRCRRVVLRGAWWQGDSGPMVALLDEAEPRAVALLPDRAGRYVMHDPATGTRRRVTAAVAERLAAGAMGFYRALPAHALSPRDVLRFALRGLRSDVLRMLGAGAVVGVLGMATPLVTGWLVDDAIPAADRTGVLTLAAALLATSVAALLLGLARALALLRIQGRIDGALQAAVWDRVLRLPAAFFRGHAAGDLALRINAVNRLREGLSEAAMAALLSGLVALCNVALMFVLAPGLAALGASLIAVALAVSWAGGWIKLRHERAAAALAGRISGMVHDYLGGIVKLRLCAAEARAFANWAARYGTLRALTRRGMRVATFEQAFFGGWPVLAQAAVFGAWGAGPGAVGVPDSLSTGGFIAFLAAFGVAFASTMDLALAVLAMLKLVPLAERTRPILQALPECEGTRPDPGPLQGEIEVQDLTFGYGDGPAVLAGVSFRIRPGEFVAIVGASGSGKSTLLRLLMGFERPQRGSVCYDGLNLLDLDLGALRRRLGVVLQSGRLLPGDLLGNIVGMGGATLAQAWEAARLCGLADEIESMPMGMHTVVGEGSSTLSGGQRQRILIARAIVGRPRVLLLDEATSALDNHSQRQVADTLARMDATRVVIAHRLSTVVHADRILVLHEGRLVQSGTYAELAALPGPFADLVQENGHGHGG